jgi:BON domain
MDTPNSRRFPDEDSRDNRTTQGPSPMPITSRDMESEARPLSPADDPVNAVSPGASPSSYTQRDIDEGNTPIDQELEEMVDPGLGREQLSTNPDVLNLDDSWRVESEEADFMGDPGTVDVIEAVEEGEPFFPPTDPVIRIEGYNDADVLGGFAATSLEEPTEVEDVPGRAQGGDDEIAQRVRYALSTDAYTADLNIEVEVEDGVVYLHGTVGSLDDVEQAEQVAGSVEGVVDVEEDLEIV